MHADYAGPIMGKMVLVVVDAYSKWMEASVVSAANSYSTIENLRWLFPTFGLPEILVTDNGSVFTASEFQDFMRRNGNRNLRSAPYHPATNGLAERAVQTLKAGLKKAAEGSLEMKVFHILFNYHLTPHSTTGVSPAQLMLGRQPLGPVPSQPLSTGRMRLPVKRRDTINVRSVERCKKVTPYMCGISQVVQYG